MVHPWIPFPTILPLGGIATFLSDILVLAVKESLGKLRSNEGQVTAAGDIATLTANTGKDMYLARAQVTFTLEGTLTSAFLDEVVIKINGTVIETAKSSMAIDSGEASQSTIIYEFKNIGHKVTAGQIIVMEAITVDTDTTIEGFIECFEENTGTNPLDDF